MVTAAKVVASIKTALGDDWAAARKKDPGKRIQRREAIERKRWARKEKQFKELWRDGNWSDSDEEEEVLVAPVSTRRRRAKAEDTEPDSTTSGASSGTKTRRKGSSVDEKETEGDPSQGGDQSGLDVAGQPLRMRGSPQSSRREAAEEDEGDEWTSQEEEDL